MIGYSDFLEEVRGKRIKSAHAPGRPAAAPRSSPSPTTTSKLRTTATYLDRGLVGDLINNGVKFDVKPREEQSLLHEHLHLAGSRCCC